MMALIFWLSVAYLVKFLIDGFIQGFKTLHKPKVGQFWYRKDIDCSPWKEKDIVQITDIKKGWLKYDISPPNLFKSTSKISDFRRCYRLVKEK